MRNWSALVCLVMVGCARKAPVEEKKAPLPLPTPSVEPVFVPPPPPPPVDFLTSPKFAFSKENVDAFCREEWTKRGELDQAMFSHCVQKETAGHAEAQGVIKRLADKKWLQTLMPAIWAEWTKRGVTQYSMVAYSLKQEEDGFKTYMYNWDHDAATDAKFTTCEAKWRSHSKRWTMTNYCLKSE